MKAKEFVKMRMPKARAEKHTQGMIKGMQKTYWLIRNNRNYMYFAQGDTEKLAWENAKNRIVQLEHEGHLVS